MALKVMNGLDLQSQRITALADGTAATDAVTKQQLDNAVQGLSWKDSVRVATTTNGALATAYENGDSVDGVTLATGDRILIKNQTTQTENGIYVVNASGAPTRAVDADSGTDLLQATVYVEAGTTQADTAWVMNVNAPITIGSTNIVFVQFGTGGTTYSAGNGLQLVSTTFSVLANGSSIDVSASGVKIADAAGGAGLTVSAGVLAVGAGTGITVNADDVAINTAVVVRKFAGLIGDGSSTTLTVTHNLGTQDVTWSVRDASTNAFVLCDAVANGVNTLQLTFAVAPASNAYRVVVHA